MEGFDPLGLVVVAAKAVLRLEAKDGQEPTVESLRQQPEEILPPRPVTEQDQRALSQRGAALAREFWESQS